jgi:hypothetical protein
MSAIICNMAKPKKVSPAKSDTSGMSLADFKANYSTPAPASSASVGIAGKTYKAPGTSKAYVGPASPKGNPILNTTKNVVRKVDSALDASNNVLSELTGAKDVLRFAKNRTKTNAAFVGLSAAAYLLPGIKAVRAPGKALLAGEAAAIDMMASRSAKELAVRSGQQFTTTMKLKNSTGTLNAAKGEVTQLFGKSVSTTGPKSYPAVAAATQRMMNEAARDAVKLSTASSAGTIKGLLAGSALVAAENVVTAKMKNKQYPKIKKK